MADKNEEIPNEIEPDLVDVTEWHTRMRVATKILSDLHAPLLHTSYRQRYRVKRTERFRELGNRLSELTLDVLGLQDELGRIVNEKVDEAFPEEDTNEGGA
jgi:hypothetical protein